MVEKKYVVNLGRVELNWSELWELNSWLEFQVMQERRRGLLGSWAKVERVVHDALEENESAEEGD